MHMTATEINGERIFNYLLSNGPTTKADLCHVLGLSPGQCEGGLRNIREVVADREDEPLVYDPRTYAYDIAASERQAVRYLRYRLSIIHRYLLNLETSTAAPAAVKFANPTLDLLRHQMHQIQASIQFAENMLPV